jgi:transposase
MQAIRFGIDLAKNVFQVHGVDAEGRVVVQRQLRRGQMEKFFAAQPPALIGLEACGSAHHWGRTLGALGHEAKLMPPAYVKAYVKRNKNDLRDAEACCEAVARPTMRFMRIKTVDQQCARAIHRARDLLAGQRTQLGQRYSWPSLRDGADQRPGGRGLGGAAAAHRGGGCHHSGRAF